MRPDLLIETAFLATKEQPEDKILSCGKILGEGSPGNFLFYLIELDSNEDSAVVKKIIQVISNSAKTSPDLTDRTFENILGLVNDTLGRLSGTTDNIWIGHLNAVIGLVAGEDIFLSQTGKINGYIFRHNKISCLTDQNEPEKDIPPSRTFVEITSGQFSKGDQLIFANDDLFNHISVDRLRNFVKLDSVCDEVTELVRYLKKSKNKTANAIFLRATDEVITSDFPETVYIDEPEETVLQTIGKEIKPWADKVWDWTKIFSIFVYKHSKTAGKKLQKDWREKYGPKSQELLKGSGSVLKQTFDSTRHKLDEIGNSKEFKHLKIKAHSYQFQPKKNYLSFIPWAKITELKFLFSQKNRKILYAIILVLVLVFGYGKIRINNNRREEKIKEVEVASAYDQAKEIFQQAKEDLLLGKTDNLDRFNEALTLAQKAKGNDANADNATKLIRDINDILDEKTKTVRFYDSTMFKLGDGIKHIVLSGSQIYGINQEGKIYMADVRDHETKLVASAGLGKGAVQAMTTMGSSSILMATDQNKILSFDIATNTIGDLSNAEADGLWKGTKNIATYSTNIYSLDTDTGTVWKYVANGTGYSKGTDYADTKKVSLDDAASIAVDGNIFVLKHDGSVAKFVKGAYDPDFALKNIPAPNSKIASPSKIYTSEDMNSIFVLDKELNRIVKFDKSGAFLNQYIFDGIMIDNFVVNTKLQKIWVLSDGNIWEGNL